MKIEPQAFIVRIWSDSDEIDDPSQSLRGMIEHVGSSKRSYFYDLEGIRLFIQEELRIDQKETKRIDTAASFAENSMRDEGLND